MIQFKSRLPAFAVRAHEPRNTGRRGQCSARSDLARDRPAGRAQ